MAPGSPLATALAASRRKSPHFAKDVAKAARATQFIGQGSAFSSTQAYADAAGPLANTGAYGPGDVVFVSCEGDRRGRFAPFEGGVPRGAYLNLDLAMAAGATLVLDIPADRARAYNVGEREVAAYLRSRGCIETRPGNFASGTPPTPCPPEVVKPAPRPRFRGGPLPPAVP